ncbi:MAG: diadenylate cyclase, partial [Candidatus Cryptobacteroides sp.]
MSFIKMSFADIIDIILVAVIIFVVFRWIRGTSAMSIFAGILSLYVIKVVAAALDMKLMSEMMSAVLDVGVIALIVIFQPEIRRFLASLGDRYRDASQNKKFFLNLFGSKKTLSESNAVNEVTEACRRMSEDKTGALIVIEHKASLDDIINTGDKIDAAIHRRLIMNLFFKNSPLHDGA